MPRLVPLAPLTALALVPLACGGGSGAADVANAAAKTSTGSYAVSMITSMDLPSLNQPVAIKAAGVFDSKTRRGRLALDLSELSNATGQNLGSAVMVLEGTNIYMRLPFLHRANPRLKPWLKINLQQAARAQGVDFSSFLQLGQGGDPTQSLEYLRGAGHVKKLGKAQVRGVETTQYRTTIDLAKVPDQAPKKARPELRKSIKRVIRLTGQKTIPAEVWIDHQGRARRMVYRQKFLIANQRLNSAVSMDIYDFGTNVAVSPPPASEVTDLTKLTAPPQGSG